MPLPSHTIQLLSKQSRIVNTIKEHAWIDRSISDGVIPTQFYNRYPDSKTGISSGRASSILRVNPMKPILDVYNMVYLQDRPFHVSISATNKDYEEDANRISLFISSLFDKINIAETLRKATTVALKEGISFIHYHIQQTGIPHCDVLSSRICNWDMISDKISPDLSKSTTFFAFQYAMPFSSMKIRFNSDVEWQDISGSIPTFSGMIGTYSSESLTKSIAELNLENDRLTPENRLALVTVLYERTADGQFEQQIIFNGQEIIHRETYPFLPIIPVYISSMLELREDRVWAAQTIVSPVRQLLVTLNEIERTIFRYVKEHYPVRIAVNGVIDPETSADIEDHQNFSEGYLSNRILKTTSQKAADAFSVLYPVNIDPTLLSQYEFILNKIYQFTGVTPDLLGEISSNRQETDSLFKSRNMLSIQRINTMLERCCNVVVALAQQFLDHLSNPIPFSKMRSNKSLIRYFISEEIDPTQPQYQWEGLSKHLTVATKRYYDTTNELMSLSMAKMVEGGFLDPRLIVHMLPFLDKDRVDEMQQQDNKKDDDKNAIQSQKNQADAEIRQMEIEERSQANRAKARNDEMKILEELIANNEGTSLNQSQKELVKTRFFKLLNKPVDQQ